MAPGGCNDSTTPFTNRATCARLLEDLAGCVVADNHGSRCVDAARRSWYELLDANWRLWHFVRPNPCIGRSEWLRSGLLPGPCQDRVPRCGVRVVSPGSVGLVLS